VHRVVAPPSRKLVFVIDVITAVTWYKVAVIAGRFLLWYVPGAFSAKFTRPFWCA
jgi:hypothetical protein